MPNLKPPVTTTARAVEYREEILKALPPGSSFQPLMTLYLTDNTCPEEIKLASTNFLYDKSIIQLFLQSLKFWRSCYEDIPHALNI